MIVEQNRGIQMACQLLEEYKFAVQAQNGARPSYYQALLNDDGVLKTPGWIAPLLLMVDLYEKTCTASTRRWVLAEVCFTGYE
jgi:hypothetical protein